MIRYRSFSPEAGRPKELVLLDVDGTIFPDMPDEFTGVAYWHMYENGLLKTGSEEEVELLRNLRSQYGFHPDMAERKKYYSELNPRFDAQISGRSRATVDRIADDIIEQRLEDAFEDVMQEISAWQDTGRYVGYISGSPNFLIQALKRATNADIATGTRFFTSGGGTYHPSRRTETRGRDKHLIAESMLIDLSTQRLRKLGRGAVSPMSRPSLTDFDSEDLFTLRSSYGDTVNDESMMTMALDPVAVRPKPDLREIANKERWRVIDEPGEQTP